MTKLVRVENADNSHYDLEVKAYDKHPDGDVLRETRTVKPLEHTDIYIHSGIKLVIEEK